MTPRCSCPNWRLAANPHGKINHRPPVLTFSPNYSGHPERALGTYICPFCHTTIAVKIHEHNHSESPAS